MEEITKSQSCEQQTTGSIQPDITLDDDLAALLMNTNKFFLVGQQRTVWQMDIISLTRKAFFQRFHQLQQQTKQIREEQEQKQQQQQGTKPEATVDKFPTEEWSKLSRSIQQATVLLGGDAENKLHKLQIKELKKSNCELRKQLDDLEHSVSQRCETDDTKKTIDRLEKKIAELRLQKEFAETEATMRQEKLSRSNESGEKQLAELRNGYESIIRKLSDDKMKLREEILEMNAKHEALQERLHRLESQSMDFLSFGGSSTVPVRAANSGKRISEVVQFFPKGSDIAPATGTRQKPKRRKNL